MTVEYQVDIDIDKEGVAFDPFLVQINWDLDGTPTGLTTMDNPAVGQYTYDASGLTGGATYRYTLEITWEDGEEVNSQTISVVAPAEATSSNSLTFEDIYEAVEMLLYGTRAGTAAQIAEAKIHANLGYREFLQEHDWEFLQPETTLSAAEDDTETDLPSDFGYLISRFRFGPGTGYAGPVVVSMDQLRALRENLDTSSDYPTHCAVSVKSDGSYQVSWYPTLSATTTFYYAYRVEQADMANDSDTPLGGAKHCMTVLAYARKQAAEFRGEDDGSHHRLAKDRLAVSLQRDAASRDGNVGTLAPNRSETPRTWDPLGDSLVTGPGG